MSSLSTTQYGDYRLRVLYYLKAYAFAADLHRFLEFREELVRYYYYYYHYYYYYYYHYHYHYRSMQVRRAISVHIGRGCSNPTLACILAALLLLLPLDA